MCSFYTRYIHFQQNSSYLLSPSHLSCQNLSSVGFGIDLTTFLSYHSQGELVLFLYAQQMALVSVFGSSLHMAAIQGLHHVIVIEAEINTDRTVE